MTHEDELLAAQVGSLGPRARREWPAERSRQPQAVAQQLVLGHVGRGLLRHEDAQRAVALEPGHVRVRTAGVAGAVRVDLGVPADDVQLLAPPSVGPVQRLPDRHRIDVWARRSERPDHEHEGRERAEGDEEADTDT